MAKEQTSIYKYKAINKKGRIINGSLSAHDEVHLYQQLEQIGLSLIKGNKIKREKTAVFSFLTKHPIKLSDRIQLYFQLLQLQVAEIPLVKALDYAANSITNQQLVDIANDMKRMVSEGLSMSESMAKFPECFTRLEMAIMKISERTGDMAGSYRYLIAYLEEAEKMNQQMKKATRYPLILLFVISIALVVMMGYVVPQITSFLKSATNIELPFHTLALMATSEFFQSYWMHMAGVITALVVSFKLLRKYSEPFKYKTDYIILNMPVVGDLVRKMQISRFMHVLSTLYIAGIPILSSLKEARRVMTNEIMSAATLEVIEDVNNGLSIADALNNTGEFQILAIQLIDVAEKSSGLDKAFDQVTTIYKNEVDETIKAFIDYIEPALTMVMGILVFWIVVSVFGPIYSIFDEVGV
jgi:type IV pilus assembly protein PilC